MSSSTTAIRTGSSGSTTRSTTSSPLYWGDSGMDIPFQDREALVDQWGTDSRGLLTDEEWAGWIEDAREDDRFGEQEVAELARELPGDRAAGADTSDGGGGGLRDILGL
ncbi:hypothetical protein ACFQL1_15370 [Halomicroarcula sp. GCM10025709]|uniref:hypothetical protein n=1 Tax=Halomicroarcula sp. GCM10025709 TaxID=3252669 RepID=UPI0036075FAA